MTRRDKELQGLRTLAAVGADILDQQGAAGCEADAVRALLRSHAAQQAQLKRTLAELRGVKAANAKLFELMEARRFKNEAALQAVEVIRDGE